MYPGFCVVGLLESWLRRRRRRYVDAEQVPGVTRAEQTELTAAKAPIRELETEVAILKEPVSCSRSRTTQKAARGSDDDRGRSARPLSGRIPPCKPPRMRSR